MKENITPEIPLTWEKFGTEIYNNSPYYQKAIHYNWHAQNTRTVRIWHKYVYKFTTAYVKWIWDVNTLK